MGFEGFPLAVGWELTLACNLRCNHCGSAAGAPRSQELTVDEALAICEQLPALLVREVDFTGGEPLCHSAWDRIAARLRELGIRTKLITNGMLLGPDTARRLQDSGIGRVGLSIDGLEATHDWIRSHLGLFRHATAGIEELLNLGVPATAITTVNEVNVGELPMIRRFLETIGVDVWQFQPIFPLGRAREFPDMTLSQDAFLQFGDFARDIVSVEDVPRCRCRATVLVISPSSIPEGHPGVAAPLARLCAVSPATGA